MREEEKIFLEGLEELLSENYETRMNENVLAFVLSDLGLYKSSIKGELMFYSEDCEIEDKISGMLQIYFTVCTYSGGQEDELAVRLLEVNEQLTLGNFGLYEPYSQIFYRYCVLIPDLEAPDAFTVPLIALAKMAKNLDYLYNYMTIIGDSVGNMTLEEYRENMSIMIEEINKDPDFLDKLGQGDD